MRMDREIVLERHLIEAWGLWYIEWQKQIRDNLRGHAMSAQVVVNNTLVSTEADRTLR